jgi:hypothetical protein
VFNFDFGGRLVVEKTLGANLVEKVKKWSFFQLRRRLSPRVVSVDKKELHIRTQREKLRRIGVSYRVLEHFAPHYFEKKSPRNFKNTCILFPML